MTPEVYVERVEVEQEEVCLATAGQDPNDCAAHEHLTGRRRLVIEVRPVEGGDEYEAALTALVGSRVRLAADGRYES